MREEKILASAQFDPRLKTYFLLQQLGLFALTFVLIPIIPFWLILGHAVHRRQFEALGCDLTPNSLNVRRGFLFKVQKNIPLDKITDLAVNEGPILRHLGLCSLRIETAGGGQGSSMGQASLPGVVAALEFRDKVLDQRELVAGGGSAPAAAAPADDTVLGDIRDTLHRIEKTLSERS